MEALRASMGGSLFRKGTFRPLFMRRHFFSGFGRETGAVVLLLLLAGGMAAAPARTAFATDLFLNDEPEAYAAIDKLAASGYLPGFLANTRPYSMAAVRAALGAASRSPLPEGIDAGLIRWLSSYAGPTESARLSVAGTHADSRFIPWNHEGIPVPSGWGGLVSFSAREEKTPFFSGQLRAASFFGEGGDDGTRLLDASLSFGYPYASIQAGKISAWYGPGRRGALLFTNNAAPYPGIRIHNPVPIRPPRRYSFLGPFQYEVFAARMEKRPVRSRAILAGTRLALSPRPWIEAGFSRVLHFGSDDPSDRSNTLGAWDLTLTLPFPSQPVQLYLERAAEGDSHWERIFVPWDDRYANLLGIYLPRVLSTSRLDLRAEYADSWSGENKDANWYGHAAYPHAYRGEVLGHPMGGSARHWVVRSRCWFLPTAWGTLSWERVQHNGGPSAGERRTLWSAGLGGWATGKWRAEALATVDRASRTGGIPGPSGTDFSARLQLSYQVNTLSTWIEGEM